MRRHGDEVTSAARHGMGCRNLVTSRARELAIESLGGSNEDSGGAKKLSKKVWRSHIITSRVVMENVGPSSTLLGGGLGQFGVWAFNVPDLGDFSDLH